MTSPDITQDNSNIDHTARFRPFLGTLLTSDGPVALFYLAAITLAEVVTTLGDPRLGLILHAIIMFGMLIHAAFINKQSLQFLIFSLTLAPLIRLVSLSLPLVNFSFVYWYMIVGVPLFLAAFITARVVQIDRKKAGVVLGRYWLIQIPIGLAGLGLGYVEYLILRPEPLINEFSWVKILGPAMILLVFTGFLEEYIFRGVLQYTAKRSLGWGGFIYISAVFAVLHIGYKSILDLVFVFVVALFFSFLAYITRSLLGVTLAHGMTNIALFLIFPFLGVSPQPVAPQMFIELPPVVSQVVGSYATLTPNQVNSPALWSAPPTHTSAAVIIAFPTMTGLPRFTTTSTSTLVKTPTLTRSICLPPDKWIAYIVQPGDTLAKFRHIYHLPKSSLLAANCNEDLIEVYAGQKFFLPYLPTPPAPFTKPSNQPTVLTLPLPGERPTPEPPSSRP